MMSMRYGELQKKLKENRWYVYGSGIVAYNIVVAIEAETGQKPECFFVTKRVEKERFISAERIRVFEEARDCVEKESLILIAVPEVYHGEIEAALRNAGFHNLVAVNSVLEYEIMGKFFHDEMKFPLIHQEETMPGKMCYNKDEFQVFMVKSDFDKPLQSLQELPEFVKPLYAGAALSGQNITCQRDDEGINISYKNRNYCELTASYWIWKHTKSTYKGICHYRRFFYLNEGEIEKIPEHGIDVVLPLPFLCANDISDQYLRYVGKEDMEILKQVLKKKYPEEYEAYEKILKGRLIHNYNMVIAKNGIFDEYCEWMFEILFEVEKKADADGTREDRYAGYLGEILTTIYFLKNKNRWNIYYTGKNWLV